MTANQFKRLQSIHDLDLGNEKILAQILANAGVNADDLMSDISDQSIKDELKENTQDAIQRGVFGAPTFFVGGEMFFGNDRLDFIREALASRE